MAKMRWTEHDLVRESGASRSAVWQWLGKGSKEIHSIKAEYAAALQEKTGFSAKWIASGKGLKMAPGASGIPLQDVDAEHSVIYITVLSMLSAFPDPDALLASFDGVVSGMNARGELPGSVLLGLQRLRSQIVRQTEAKRRTSPR